MTKYRQRISHPGIGDCFRACMATLLDLPPEVLPNDFSPAWHWNWQRYLEQFGLSLSPSGRPDGAIWLSTPWIATVKSLNFEGALHAIVMHEGSRVYHDPSSKKRYRTGSRLTTEEVLGGRHLVVSDASRLGLLAGYQKQVKGWLAGDDGSSAASASSSSSSSTSSREEISAGVTPETDAEPTSERSA